MSFKNRLEFHIYCYRFNLLYEHERINTLLTGYRDSFAIITGKTITGVPPTWRKCKYSAINNGKVDIEIILNRLHLEELLIKPAHLCKFCYVIFMYISLNFGAYLMLIFVPNLTRIVFRLS